MYGDSESKADVEMKDEWEVVSEPAAEPTPDGGEAAVAAVPTTGAGVEPVKGPAGVEPGSDLDLCFICDCTGSMGSYIRAAQSNIITIVQKISEEHGAGVRFGLISYRDHPPQEKTYVTQVFPFTEEKSKMRESVDSMSARGGGDGPEAVTAGLYEALHMPWRPNATKVCVLIADAPPHGLEPQGDGFPNGDPDGRDPLEIAREMVVEGITVYTVGCEPALGRYQFARDFLCTLAEITSGQAVALSSAAMLANVIINGSVEELSLAKLQRQVEDEVLKIHKEAKGKGRSVAMPDAIKEACGNLQKGGMQSMQMQTDGRMTNSTRGHWGGVKECEQRTLAQVKASLHSAYPAAAASPSLSRITGSSREEAYGKGGGAKGGRLPMASRRDVFGKGGSAGAAKGKGGRGRGSSVPGTNSEASSAPSSLTLLARKRNAADASGGAAALMAKEACFAAPACLAAPSPMVLQSCPSAAPAVQAAASSNQMMRGLITEDQVARIVQKAQYQQRLP